LLLEVGVNGIAWKEASLNEINRGTALQLKFMINVTGARSYLHVYGVYQAT
jgi:hypothetical protein